MKPTRVALITTTINVPTMLEHYLTDWRISSDILKDSTLDVIVAGDVQTPPKAQEFVEANGGTYIGVDSALAKRWRTDKHVGHRSIQRRNIALLHAIASGAEVIVTVDDDNTPSMRYFSKILNELDPTLQRRVFTSARGWFDPGSLLYPRTVARGFPLAQRHPYDMAGVHAWMDTRVGVVNGLTTGDPDIDAIERLVNWPKAQSLNVDTNMVLGKGTWAPFNTQNTAFVRELAPLMQCLVGVGRYDDIFMSYIARVVMDQVGLSVSYGHPTTHSERNDHDILVDLEKEVYGYRRQKGLIEALRDLVSEPSTETDVIELLSEAYEQIAKLLPKETDAANSAWLEDVESAMKEGNV